LTCRTSDKLIDSETFEKWAFDYTLSATDKLSMLWEELKQNAKRIRKILSPKIEPVSSLDWKLNTGAMLLLRELPYRWAKPALCVVWIEVWVDFWNTFNFIVVKCTLSGILCLSCKDEFSRVFDTKVDYSEVVEFLQGENYALIDGRLYPERMVDGIWRKTGEWFEYWYDDLTTGEDFVVLRQIEGEEIKLFQWHSDPIVLFESYQEACSYLLQEELVMARGRCEV
jgi:hypothetical protein